MPPCGAGVSSMARFVYGLFGLWNGRPPGAVFNFQFSICNLQSALGNPKAVSVSANFEFAAPALLERLPVDVSRRGDGRFRALGRLDGETEPLGHFLAEIASPFFVPAEHSRFGQLADPRHGFELCTRLAACPDHADSPGVLARHELRRHAARRAG